MPFIHIRVAGRELAPAEVERLHARTTGLMAGVLGKRADLTSVLVEAAAPGGWAVGGRPVPLAAHLEASVTAGTNGPEEKARFVAEAMAMLREVLGEGLPLATYVVVREVPADAWGYGGLTQAARARA